ncbi:hypothetical protein EVAR_74324_1 [Eumeta japonica]|uniref:Uncharacterized protein n=1 Tax=Eumeta variegata TaxID=151549 RepID=A0A4C1SFM9_EUMVA|nr:hypothetical protein EVAR_74324_1 [Eumeta japonica]
MCNCPFEPGCYKDDSNEDSTSKTLRFILVLKVLPFRRTANLEEIDIQRGPAVQQKLIPNLSVFRSMKRATSLSSSIRHVLL